MRRTLWVLAVLAGTACDDLPVPGRDGATTVAADSVHERHLLFLADQPDGPVAAVLHFGVTPARDRLVRSVRGWVGSGPGWDRLLLEEWRTPVIRDAGRLVPGGGVRVMVGDSGDLEALRFTTAQPPVRLVNGDPIGEWTRTGRERLTLERGSMIVGDHRYEGALLWLAEARPAGADRATVRRVLLTDGARYMVFSERADAGPLALLADSVVRTLELAVHPAPHADEGAAPRWLVTGPDSTVFGSLEPIAPGWRLAGEIPAAEIVGVRGTLDVDGTARPVVGVIHLGGR